MGLFEPSNVYPSSLGGVGNGTIDVSNPLTVSWQVNGNTPMTGFSIEFYTNDVSATSVYSTGRLTSGCPFDGVDYKGNVQFFSYTIPSSVLTNAGMTNGNSYKMVITQYWNALDSIVQSSASAFITRSTPQLSIVNVGTTIAAKDFSFVGSYSQAQGDSLMWCRWMLATASDLDNPLVDTHNIYGTSNLQLDYDGFFSGTTYAVRLMIQTENGIQADTGWVTFNVEYDSAEIDGYVDVCTGSGTSANLVSWPKILYIQGTPTGSYSIARDQLTLPSGSSVTWDSVNGSAMSFPYPWTIVWKGTAPPGTTVFEASGGGYTLSFSVQQDGFYILLNGSTLCSVSQTYQSGNWWTVVLTSSNAYITFSSYSGGLYPDTTLYPNTTLYPKAEVFDILDNQTFDVSVPPMTISGLELYGEQTCAYLWALNGTIDADVLNEIQTNSSFVPSQTSNTYFLCNFQNGLLAGNLPQIGDNISGYAIYRIAEGDSAYSFVGNFPITTSQFLDYSARSNTPYTYYMRATGASTFATQPLVSKKIQSKFWSWTLLEAELDTDGLLHVLQEFRFRLNISSGSVSNNNNPTVLQNFTPYPTVQPAPQNYKSGTLSSLVGYVDYSQGVPTYINTIQMRDAILSLSNTQNYIILKNPVGDVFPVRTNGPITVQIKDKTMEQIMTISIPWVQTAEEPSASVVSTPGDTFWPYN